MANNISAWNAKLAKTRIVPWIGDNGVAYEYYIPYGKTFEEALDVKSHKKSLKYDNDKRPGEYQPVGNKRNFTFYQARIMKNKKIRASVKFKVIK